MRSAFPCNESVPFAVACFGIYCCGGDKVKEIPQPPEGAFYPAMDELACQCALCCQICGFRLSDDCCGSQGEGEFCCIENKGRCICFKCCVLRGNCFCIDARESCPPTIRVPATCSCCGA